MTAASPHDAASLADLLADRIDALELATGTSRPSLTPEESQQLNHTITALHAKLASVPTENDRQSHLLSLVQSLYEADYHNRRSLAHGRDRIERLTNQKSKLESLCKDLSNKNVALKNDVVRAIEAGEHATQSLRSKFETSLTNIQQQISAQSAEREAQAQSQAALKSHIEKLMALDATRESHHAKILESKDLEAKILKNEALQMERLKINTELQNKELQVQLAQLTKYNEKLTEQLTQYSSKFNEIEGMLSSNNNVFTSMKSEMTMMQKSLMKAEKAKLAEMEKNRESHAVIIQFLDEKKEWEERLLRSEKQRLMMQNLNNELSKQMRALKSKNDSGGGGGVDGASATSAAVSGGASATSAAVSSGASVDKAEMKSVSENKVESHSSTG